MCNSSILLKLHRDELIEAIFQAYVSDWGRRGLVEKIWLWWNAYKYWESKDAFLKAYTESRLFMTMRPPGNVVYTPIEVKTEKKGKKQNYPAHRYAVGADNLAQRMNPENFQRAQDGSKLKYSLGLLDLSGTLLNPKFPSTISNLRWSLSGNHANDLIVFIPLPNQEDIGCGSSVTTAHEPKSRSWPWLHPGVAQVPRRPLHAAAFVSSAIGGPG